MAGQHRIAVIAGDGIGKEVMPEGLRVLDAAGRKFGIDLRFDVFDFSCWDYCDLLRCRRLARNDCRPRVAVGLFAAVSPRV
jgi:isocitrate/isopropylmalate dehydrogenase